MERKYISFVILIFLYLDYTSAICRFNQEVYGTKYPWRIMSPDYNINIPHSHRKVRFDGGSMVIYYIPSGEGDTVTVVYTCEEGYYNERFMVSMHQDGRSVLYTCIEFKIRSKNVIQIKMADPNRVKSPALCGEAFMKLLPAPMVYFHVYDNWVLERMPVNSYHPCPLDGGYVLREWFDERGRSAYRQDKLIPPVKIENECEKGEGFRFVCDRNHARCPLPHPGLHQKENFCLGNWMDDEYTYMVIYNEADDRMIPCIRYPNKHDDEFTAHVFLDGVCDTGEPITDSRHFRRLSLRREPESYCGDRTSSCARIDRSKCSRGLSNYCRFTCGTCANPSAVWKSLKIYPDFRGAWVKDTKSMGYENIVFDAEYVNIPSLGRYRLYEKYWYDPYDNQRESSGYNPDQVRKEYLMIGTYTNGCSPRVSLLNVVKRSNAVLSLRVSQPAVIETFSQTQRALESMDKLLDFNKKPKSNLYESYRNWPGNWFNIVRAGETLPNVHCNLGYTHFGIQLPDGRYCDGLFDSIDAHNFEMNFKACNSTNIPGVTTEPPAPTRFECLSRFQGDYDNTYLVTRMWGGFHNLVRHRYICWAFSRSKLGSVHWMRISECDSSSEDYVERGLRTAIATVRVDDLSDLHQSSTYMKWIVCFMIFFRWLFGI